MADITVTIPKSVYDTLDAVRKQNTQPQPDPNNPEGWIVRPRFASVEDWLEQLIEESIAPIVQQVPSPEVAAIRAAIEAKQAELKAASKSVKVKKSV
jgi:hypothetical protein